MMTEDRIKIAKTASLSAAFGRMGSFEGSVPFCLIVSALFTVVVNAALILNAAYLGPDDDYGIALVLSGVYADSGLCLFVNALLSNVIFGLNQLLPEFNWFLVVERFSSTVAYFALCYALMRRAPLGVALSCIGFVSFLIMPYCTLGANFTVVGALNVMAGAVCMFSGIVSGRWSAVVCGALLGTVGYLWRTTILYLAGPFCLLALAPLAVLLCGERRGQAKDMLLRLVGGVALLVVLVGGAMAYNSVAWNEEKWAQWEYYNDARSALSDYPLKDYEDIADELDAIGVSEIDYWAITHWTTGDPEVITADKLHQVLEIAKDPQDVTLGGAAKSELSQLLHKGKTLVVLLLAVAVATALASWRRSTLIVVALSLAGAFCLCVVFRYIGRLPTRVEYPIWLYSMLPGIVCACAARVPWRGEAKGRCCSLTGASTATGAVALIACLVLLGVRWLPTFDVAEAAQFKAESDFARQNELVQHFTSSDDAVYVWDVAAFTKVERALKFRYLPPRSLMEVSALMGGWTQGSSFIEEHWEQLGTPNPMEALVSRPDTYYVAMTEYKLDHVQKYLDEHYAPGVQYEVVEKVSLGNPGADPILVARYYRP